MSDLFQQGDHGPQDRKRDRAPEPLRGKPSGAEAPRPALEGANRNVFANLAAAEYARRVEAIDAQEAANAIAPTRATHLRLCWLAIASAAGADLPELVVEGEAIFPPGQPFTRRLPPHDIIEASHWQAELHRARTVAVEKAMANLSDSAIQARSLLLQSLAIHLGLPPVESGEERKAA